VAVGPLICVVRDDLRVQGRSEDQRELLDAESVAGHLLKAGSVFGFLAGHRRELFPDEMFADLFPTGRGRPSMPADLMAAVITLQTLHGLSDGETVEAVTFDLRRVARNRLGLFVQVVWIVTDVRAPAGSRRNRRRCRFVRSVCRCENRRPPSQPALQ